MRDNQVVPNVPRGLVHQREVANAIRQVEDDLRPDVVRIRFTLGSDWTGDPSIFFRIVLSDNAAKPSRLQEVAQHVTMCLSHAVDAMGFDSNAYFNFRSNAEQEVLQEPEWA